MNLEYRTSCCDSVLVKAGAIFIPASLLDKSLDILEVAMVFDRKFIGCLALSLEFRIVFEVKVEIFHYKLIDDILRKRRKPEELGAIRNGLIVASVVDLGLDKCLDFFLLCLSSDDLGQKILRFMVRREGVRCKILRHVFALIKQVNYNISKSSQISPLPRVISDSPGL